MDTKRWIVALLFALVVMAGGYHMWSQNIVVFDDSYISYRYADNLASGHGLVYNVGERVQGYTNFLWTLLAAGAISLGIDPLGATRSIGVTAHLVELGTITAFAMGLWLRSGLAGLWMWPVLGVLIAPEGFAAIAGSGLEEPFVAFLVVAAGIVLYAGELRARSTQLLLIVIMSLACLTRLDCVTSVVALAAAVGIAELLEREPGKTPWKRAAIDAAIVSAPVALVVLIFLAFSYGYYGYVMPNTYYAKAANEAHVREGFEYLWGFARSELQSLPLLALNVLGVFNSRDPRRRRLCLYTLLAVLAELVHIVRVGGDFMEYRFMWQLYGLLALGAVTALANVLEEARGAALVLSWTILSMSFQPIVLEKVYGMQSLHEMDNYARMGEDIGIKLGQVLPPQIVIATTLAGTLAYFGKRTTIDQWGLNDVHIAHQAYKHPSLPRGHVKFAPIEYLKSRHVNLYIEHPVVCSCAHPCRESKPNVFIRLAQRDRCLRAWYMEEQPKLTSYFCDHPDWFVLNKVYCKKPGSHDDSKDHDEHDAHDVHDVAKEP